MKHKLYTNWIDVEDKLPYEIGNYLVVAEGGLYIARFDGGWEAAHGWYTDANDDNVTHWMALPTPPGNNDQT